ncbi:MAG: 4-hydroxythreonine-4-phosphate dehydrogenase PdxA [Candidatus Omnitrophica bacterium]|nr:4-hydroxythreonine-4-phosphate dehydrogenase PdxA [Candidatus Omnitrophota bacterium]
MKRKIPVRPVACITMGYPAGIGPEVISKALASPKIRGLANFLIIGDESVFRRALRLSGKRLSYKVIRSALDVDFNSGSVLFLDLENVKRKGFSFGKVCASCGRASIEYIREAVSLIRSERADLLVTGPIHKHAAMAGGFTYPGHTGYLAHLAHAKDYAMMFTGGPLKIVLASIHIPLSKVALSLTRKKIEDALSLADASLKKYFGVKRPRIVVCGLNPHAGEDGSLGSEEKSIIIPAVARIKKKGIDVYGPVAADAVFYDLLKGSYDAAVCMYHDQGLVALKMIARDESVNITLGLGFIRTSPGHGTALDIAKKGIASSRSMEKAIEAACSMFKKGGN